MQTVILSVGWSFLCRYSGSWLAPEWSLKARVLRIWSIGRLRNNWEAAARITRIGGSFLIIIGGVVEAFSQFKFPLTDAAKQDRPLLLLDTQPHHTLSAPPLCLCRSLRKPIPHSICPKNHCNQKEKAPTKCAIGPHRFLNWLSFN